MHIYRFNSGAVFEVPLFMDYGFAYVKVIHFRASGDTLIQPLNKFSKEKFDGDFLSIYDLSYTSAPYLLLGGIIVKKKDGWKHLGDLPLLETDQKAPELKRCFKYFSSYKKDPETLDWNVVRNLNPVDYYPAQFKDIKQLGMYMHCSDNFIRNCLTVLWILRNSDKIEDYISDELRKSSEKWEEILFCTKMVV